MNTVSDKKIGAVLVQGGGIAGIQASLDLANSGFKVYLVERSAAIGGLMTQLDKTFPTGDCATCIVSPKLVECARNQNIEILTLSELLELKGEPGNFSATVKRYPGYVEEDKCTACGQCTEACPIELPNYFDRNLGKRKAIAKQYAQATPNIFNILKNGHSPCKVACPVNVNVQGYVQLIKKKQYLKAANLIRERNPLAAICGRICTHPCEASCTRNYLDEAISIRLLKRFASDQEMEMLASGKISLPEKKVPLPSAKKVAVIGAGPAGLTVADDLADRGIAVTIYEATSAAGGMLRWGIPEYRLPKEILDHEVELIQRKGVNFIFNCYIGQDITLDKLYQEYDAVFVGVGVQVSRKLGIDGEGKSGIYYGLEFLCQAAKQDNSSNILGKRVLVIGGGNVAIDVARTALRLGASNVEMVSLEQPHEMPALPEEIEATLAEGIIIHHGWGPKRFLGNGMVDGIELKRCTQVFDENKRFNPKYDENSLTILKAERVIIAIGQSLDKQFMKDKYIGTGPSFLKADPITLQTTIDGIFAGGDSISGPASVIQAISDGKRAAESIIRYLKKEDLRYSRFEDTIRPLPQELLPSVANFEKKSRAVVCALPVAQRLDNFSEVEEGLSEAAALTESERCLNCALCSECQECVAICEQKAVNHHMVEHTVELEVGSVILTPGFTEFSAEKKREFGFNRYANVLTTVQFERMLSASGPFEGNIVRCSDGREARRIAWIQCVGSRDSRSGNEYCSSVCCMVSTKQALVAKDQISGLETTIFYMDIRAHGKDFDQYFERAQKQNTKYIKSIPSRIIQMPQTKDLRVQFVSETGKIQEQDFDLVILSVGMESSSSAREAAKRLGIKLNEFGFCATDRFSPLSTSRPGVFVAGAFQEPKDIPETVTQASAAASMAMELLAKSRNTLITAKTYPGEHDIADEEPRIGVFICHCGKNIASVIDIERVVEMASKQPDVVFSTHTMYTCSDTSLSNIKEMISKHRINRIVVASCTPRTHEALFRETLRESRLNPYLFELANIRDQCSWVHSQAPELATNKAIELVNMSIARARNLAPLESKSYAIKQNGIVIGGGVSGMTAVLALADQGFKMHLIERSNHLGGNFLKLISTLEHEDISDFVVNLIESVEKHPNIEIHLATQVTGVTGYIGQFEVSLSGNGNNSKLSCGAIIVATGAEPGDTSEFLRGKSNKVINQFELERKIKENDYQVHNQNIVMIQCAGSRNDEHAYCSRICCSMAIKNVIKIKRLDPTAKIIILYRDIRTYGFREKFYKEAREAGVVFIRYDRQSPPLVSEQSDGLLVTVNSPDFPEQIEIETDSLVLSTGIKAAQDNKHLAEILKVPLNADGFFVEAHLKLRPVDFASEGIFLCGLAHSPKMTDENISQARAVAARAATILSRTHLEVNAQISWINQNKCIACLTCVRACPYGAPFVNINQKAEIAAAKCVGCGICAAECPAHAVQVNHFMREQFNAMLDELAQLSEKKNLKLVRISE